MKHWWITYCFWGACLLMGNVLVLACLAQSGKTIYFQYVQDGQQHQGSVQVLAKKIVFSDRGSEHPFAFGNYTAQLTCPPDSECFLNLSFKNVRWAKSSHNGNELRIYLDNYEQISGLKLFSPGEYYSVGQHRKTSQALEFEMTRSTTGSIPIKLKVYSNGILSNAQNKSNGNESVFAQKYRVGLNEAHKSIAPTNVVRETSKPSPTPTASKPKTAIVEKSSTNTPSQSKKSDADLWASAKKQNKIADYKNYLQNYPIGKNSQAAMKKIDSLFWVSALNTYSSETDKNTQQKALENYLAQSPNGQYRTEAQNKINNLQSNTESDVKTDDNKQASQSPNETNKGVVVASDNLDQLTGRMVFDQSKNELALSNIQGGEPPYFIQFKNQSGYTSQQFSIGHQSSKSVKLSAMQQLPKGDLEVFLTDANKSSLYPLGFVAIDSQSIFNQQWFVIALFVLALLSIVSIIFFKQKSDRQKAREW